VPPLLGTFYLVLGLLTVAADNLRPGPATAAAQARASNESSVGFLALNFGALAAALALSAALFEQQQQPAVIGAVLAAVTAVNWVVFDRTKQGLALAALCGLGAPAAEVVLMATTHCWHYPRADVASVFVSWVPWCYAFYTPAVSNLARYLWATCRPPVGYGETPPGQ
jgi:heat shock protein 5